MQHPRQHMSSRDQHNVRLRDAIRAVRRKLSDLGSFGRPGQWILHHEDLYSQTLDTRPQSRNPDEETRLPGDRFPEKGLVWAGKGPAPDFSDIAFWESKSKDLDEKIKQVEARLVQPHFTPEELDTLESLEQQSGHFFKGERLATLGRPGQWILHNEELYHPTIDTRPQTRAAEHSVVIRDSTYKGDTRVVAEVLFFNYELTWSGTGPQPNFADLDYWAEKLSNLRDKKRQIGEGLVQPRFTPEELRTLESMEADQDHAFAIFARLMKENPPTEETPESITARGKLCDARMMVASVMEDLWQHGLAGKWVLHCENLYLPEYDTLFREQDNDDDGDSRPDCIDVDTHTFRFDSRFQPRPDLDNIAYWEEKRAELRKKRDDVAAGRLTTNHFSTGELMRIELLERAILEKLERTDAGNFDSTAQRTERVTAWLNGDAEETLPAPEQPRTRTPTPTPTPTPPFHLSHGAPDAVEQQRQATEKSVDVESRQTRNSAASKRKRAADHEDEPLPGRATRPTKRSKIQPHQEPMSAIPEMQNLHRGPGQKVHMHSHSRTAPSASRLTPPNSERKTRDHPLTQRGTQQSGEFTRGGRGAAAQHNRRLRGGLPAGRVSLRRSARIAAQPPRNYR